MKKLLSFAMALVFVVTMAMGCSGLKQIRPEDPKSVEVLIDKARECQPNESGWKVVSIPQTKETLETSTKEGLNEIVAVAFQKENVIGYGLVASDGGSIVLQWEPDLNTWLYIYCAYSVQPLSEEQAAEFWKEIAKVLLSDFDLDAAYCGPPVFRAGGKTT